MCSHRCPYATAHMWKSVDNVMGLVFPSHHVGSVVRIQVWKRGGKPRYPLALSPNKLSLLVILNTCLKICALKGPHSLHLSEAGQVPEGTKLDEHVSRRDVNGDTH